PGAGNSGGWIGVMAWRRPSCQVRPAASTKGNVIVTSCGPNGICKGRRFNRPKNIDPEGGKNEALANSGRCDIDDLRRDLSQCGERCTSGGYASRGASYADPGNPCPQSLRGTGLLLSNAFLAPSPLLAPSP